MNSASFWSPCPFERKVVPARRTNSAMPVFNPLRDLPLTSSSHELVDIEQLLNVALQIEIDSCTLQPFESRTRTYRQLGFDWRLRCTYSPGDGMFPLVVFMLSSKVSSLATFTAENQGDIGSSPPSFIVECASLHFRVQI